jgi:hypothetical protein
MPEGTCRLCLEVKDLRESHYMPSALYPRRGHFEFTTPNSAGTSHEHLTQRLLCKDCEQRFGRFGESHVLGVIAPKSMKRFPLHERMRLGYARESYPSIERFDGRDFNLDMDKFAYFTLSVVWRGIVTAWKTWDGKQTTPLPVLGSDDPIRRYLLGETAMPLDTVVIVIVCSDRESRRSWFPPSSFVEALCLNYGFLARGIYFRAMTGRHITRFFRDQCCTSPRKCIFYGDSERQTREAFSNLDAMRARAGQE